MSGHLKLLQAIFTCEGIDKVESGFQLCLVLLNVFLFPASKMMSQTEQPSVQDVIEIEPLCQSESSRYSAFNLLIELTKNCSSNFDFVANQIIQMHHGGRERLGKGWEVCMAQL